MLTIIYYQSFFFFLEILRIIVSIISKYVILAGSISPPNQ